MYLFRCLFLAVSLLGCVSAKADGEPSPSPPDVAKKTDAEWRASLSAAQYAVLREKGTERAFTSPHLKRSVAGVYTCGGCGLPLFSSADKFKSGTGWPSFTQPISATALSRETDQDLFMTRTEILCSRCGGHLGHVFKDGPPPTGERYCVNGVALGFEAAEATP